MTRCGAWHGRRWASSSGARPARSRRCTSQGSRSDAQTAEVIARDTDTHALGVVSMSHTQDGRALLTNSMDGAVALWTPTENRWACAARRATLHDTHVGDAPLGFEVWASALHPDGTTMAVAGEGAHVALCHATPDRFGEGIVRLPWPDNTPAYALSLAFVRACSLPQSPDGAWLAVGTNTGAVRQRLTPGRRMGRRARHAPKPPCRYVVAR